MILFNISMLQSSVTKELLSNTFTISHNTSTWQCNQLYNTEKNVVFNLTVVCGGLTLASFAHACGCQLRHSQIRLCLKKELLKYRVLHPFMQTGIQ